ncbi:MAG TPA: DegT/DnrJ/EryC1/StrS family aminotransferase [Longimicrobiales bacterium]
MFYRHLPALSPVPGLALPRLIAQAAGYGADPRAVLRAQLMRRYQADGCSLWSSGTHALQTALTIAKQSGSAPILLPAYTCYEVATAAVGAHVVVALYDVDPLTLEPDWESVRAAASAGARALVVTPLFGMPFDWEAARRTADEMGALLIADVAQAHGTEWRGQPAGTHADLTILSFGRGKGWTGAGGGALLWRGKNTNGQVDATQQSRSAIQEAKSVARAATQYVFGRPLLYGIPASVPFLHLGETVYHEPTVPTAMTRTSAALLLMAERVATAEVSHRRRTAEAYKRWLAETDHDVDVMIGARLNQESGALRFPVLVKGGWSQVRESAAPRLGAAPGYPTTLREIDALQPLLTNVSTKFTGAETLARELVTLPTHSQTAERDRRRAFEIVCVGRAKHRLLPVAPVRQNRRLEQRA